MYGVGQKPLPPALTAASEVIRGMATPDLPGEPGYLPKENFRLFDPRCRSTGQLRHTVRIGALLPAVAPSTQVLQRKPYYSA